MIAPRKDGRGCVRGTPEGIQAMLERERFLENWRACRKSGAPRLVPLLWRGGALFLGVLGVLIVHFAFRPDPGLPWLAGWTGLGIAMLGPILLRIACEVAITVFDLRDDLSRRDGE